MEKDSTNWLGRDLRENPFCPIEKEVIPSTSSNLDGIDQNVLYINLVLKPLGGIKQKYKFEGQ